MDHDRYDIDRANAAFEEGMRVLRQRAERANRETFSQDQYKPTPGHTCSACLELKNRLWMTQAECGDWYCKPCTNELFRVATADEGSFPAKCHNVEISLDDARRLLEPDVVARYGQRMIEWRMTPAKRTYCFKCAQFLSPTDGALRNGIILSTARSLSCAVCNTSTCTVCKEAKHEAKCVRKQDKEVVQLAEEQKWKICPHCNEMIERTYGCNNMRCRCGAHFCYRCGTPWKTCDCRYFDVPPDGDDGLEAILQAMNVQEQRLNGLRIGMIGHDFEHLVVPGERLAPQEHGLAAQDAGRNRDAAIQQVIQGAEAIQDNARQLREQLAEPHGWPAVDIHGPQIRQENEAIEGELRQAREHVGPARPHNPQHLRNLADFPAEAIHANPAVLDNNWRRLYGDFNLQRDHPPTGLQAQQQDQNARTQQRLRQEIENGELDHNLLARGGDIPLAGARALYRNRLEGTNRRREARQRTQQERDQIRVAYETWEARVQEIHEARRRQRAEFPEQFFPG